MNVLKLAESFEYIKKYISLNRKDWVHLNDGDEGSGKFNLTAFCIERALTPDQLKVFFQDVKAHIHYTVEDYGYAVRNSQPYDIQVLDEPVELLARTPTAETNIELMRTLFTCREKQVLSIINVQRLFTIDWVVRDRARSLAHAYYVTNTKTLKDSYFYKFFSKAKMRKIWYEDKTHIVHYPYPNYYDRVTTFFGDKYPLYWKAYLEHKNSMTYLKSEDNVGTFKKFLSEIENGSVINRYKEYLYTKGARKKEMVNNWANRFEVQPKNIIDWLKKAEEEGI